jgi:ketosteroid isomerase-like protein
MRNWIFCLLITTLSTAVLHAQNPDFDAIRKALAEQQEAWNRGDIPAFMEHYWQSDELQFIGGNGVTKGWQATLDNYYRRYPDRAAMGQLKFGIVSMEKLAPKAVFLVGTWDLKREKDAPGGHFILIWKKIKGRWLITTDHTSSR